MPRKTKNKANNKPNAKVTSLPLCEDASFMPGLSPLLEMDKAPVRAWLEKARFVCLCLEGVLKINRYSKQKGGN